MELARQDFGRIPEVRTVVQLVAASRVHKPEMFLHAAVSLLQELSLTISIR